LAFSVKRLPSLPVSGPDSVTTLSAPPKPDKTQPTKKRTAALPKKTAATSSKITAAQKTKTKVLPEVHVTQQAAIKKTPAQKLPIAIYRDLVKDLKGPHRPGSLLALQRHIQTKFGPTAAPEKVQMLVERLLTADVIHLTDSKLGYGPTHA
jgi:hypothetical protein